MATSLTLENDSSLPQGYVKINGTTAATLASDGIKIPTDVAINGVTVGRGPGGINNTVLGNAALEENTTGYFNTAIGNVALSSNTEGYYNTAVGHGALWRNTTGDYNTAIGGAALIANTSGNGNTALGSGASIDNLTGNDNTSVGTNSLSSNQTGSNNTSIGATAMAFSYAVNNCTAVGYGAGQFATTNSNCTYIGYNVGGTAGENNVVRIGNSSTTAHYSYGDLLSWQGAGFYGTVSNTGFGAIMEYGSNANGEYVKFANGVQVCWRHWDDNAAYYADWVFPSGFSATPPGIFITLDTLGAKFGTVDETTTYPNQTRIYRWDHDGTQNESAVSMRAMAIGRWFNF